MSDILRQVDEDLRKEKLSNIWKRYGIYAISLIVIIIVIVIGFQLKVSYDKSKNESLAESYINASNLKSFNQQLLLFEEVVNSNNEFLSGLADLRIANLQIENGNLTEGQLKLEEVSNDETYEPIIRDLATYFLLLMRMDDSDNAVFMSNLTNERIKKSSLKYLFLEIIAIRKIIFGDLDEARKDFEDLISNVDLPLEIYNRATKFIELTY